MRKKVKKVVILLLPKKNTLAYSRSKKFCSDFFPNMILVKYCNFSNHFIMSKFIIIYLRIYYVDSYK